MKNIKKVAKILETDEDDALDKLYDIIGEDKALYLI